MTFLSVGSIAKFQLTRLMRGVTETYTGINLKTAQFQLTRLMRGVTQTVMFTVCILLFQLTRLMRGVTGIAFFCNDN